MPTPNWQPRSFLPAHLRHFPRLRAWLNRSPLINDAIPLLLSVIVGLVTGVGAYLFIILLESIHHLVTDLRDHNHALIGIAVMGIAGLLTGLIISRFASEAKGHGVPEVMEAIALKRGRIRPRVALAKILASAITIGSGGSAGREGPIVQVGSALGSTAGQLVKLSDEQVSMLVASGAAAGIAATFNAPIAGTLFALEVILGRFTNRYLGIVVIASVSANVVSRSLLGENPAFAVPAYGLNSPLELPLYGLLALLCALTAILFIRVLYGAEHLFERWQVPLPVKTAVGMMATGLIALLAPTATVMGPGLEFIGETIATDMSLTINVMLALLLLKLIATTFTLGSGNSGGVFAPGLFMGAMLGGLVGQMGAQIWPATVTAPGAFALVGMSALFAGSARAPITAILIVLEMSNDYRLILPLLMTVMLTTLITDFLHPDSIYTRKLALRGISLERGTDVDMLQSVMVHEVMSRDYPIIAPQTPLEELLPRFNMTHSHSFAIVDAQQTLRGIITLTDMEREIEAGGLKERTVMDAGTTAHLVTAYPDDPVYVAMRRLNMYHLGRLPVVAREDNRTYLGMIRRADIIKAYDVGLARKAIEQHRRQQYSLRDVEENEFIEVMVADDAPMVGQMLKAFPCSDDCLILSIRREGHTLIAHGDTTIQAGDVVTAYAYPEAHDAILAQFAPQAPPEES